MQFELATTQRKMRLESFRLNVGNLTGSFATTGVDEGTYRCTAKKTGTGDYSITLNQPFTRQPQVFATALHASSKLFCVVKANTTSSGVINVLVYNDAGTATDATSVDILVFGADVSDQVG